MMRKIIINNMLLALVASLMTANSFALAATLPVEFTQNPTVKNMGVGQQQVLNYTIKNNIPQTLPLTINGFSGAVTRDNSVANNCTGALSGNASCNIRLVINATTAGQINQELRIDYQGRYPLISPIDLTVGPDPLSFTAKPTVLNMLVNRTQTLDYTIKNTTAFPINFTIGGFMVPISRDNSIANNCGSSLAAGASCDVRLLVQPTAPGMINQALIVTDSSNQVLLQSQIDLNVLSLAVDGAQSSPSLYAFSGKVTTGKVTVTNPSQQNTMTGLNATVNAPVGVDLTIPLNTCQGNLAPGASCVIDLRYQAPVLLSKQHKLTVGDQQTLVVDPPTGNNASVSISYQDGGPVQVVYPVQTFAVPFKRYVAVPQNVSGYNQLPNSLIYNIAIAANGDLYASTLGGLGVSRDNGASWSNYTATNGPLSSSIFSAAANGNNLYLATFYGLAVSHDAGANFVNKSTSNGLGSIDINDVVVNGSNVYVATQPSTVIPTTGGLSISTDNGNTFVNRTTANGLGSDYVIGVYVNNGTIYAATLGGLSISQNGGANFSNKTTANGLGSDAVFGVFADGTTVYAATANGIAISHNSGASFTNKTMADGLGSDFVAKVVANGNHVYAATNNGLAVSTDGGNSFVNKTTANGLGSNIVYSVAVSGNTVYAATIAGLAVSTDGGQTFTNRTTTKSVTAGIVSGVAVLGNQVFASGLGESLGFTAGVFASNDNGGNFIRKTTADGLGSDNVSAISTNGSALFAGTFAGLSISQNNGASFVNKTTANGLGDNGVLGVFATGNTVYVATGGGLSISNNGGNSFVNKTTANGLGSDGVFSTFAAGIDVYAATTMGLSVSTDGGNNFDNRTPANSGLANEAVYSVFKDTSTGKLYAGTDGGLSISSDNGNSFTNPNDLLGKQIFRVIANGNDVYVIDPGTGAILNGGFYMSNNGGTTFNQVLFDGLPSLVFQFYQGQLKQITSGFSSVDLFGHVLYLGGAFGTLVKTDFGP